MNMTDPIADMLTRIRNAIRARHTRVLIPASKMKLALARVLKEEGYIKDIEILKDNPQGTLRLTLKYVDKKPVLNELKRVSKPGLRVYTKRMNIPRVRGGLGIAVLSTPQGLMTGSKAYKQGLGGEVICYVW
ncbi:small subunit ribosomal protein S8 [Thermosporothrix hazakensis]|jgi:small subunit ribosomal protein S8|uniref:Small ribosomal subunit protein uS8 n=2 Tax=Thermosporothrix TaxID=768650 RepID=A0A326TZT0_THEHA|nr:30S ribosomal protein S8 [Thermosporothrix hazakensis]PZW23285.1 small subunit ribosomal protein S8 [Thermosporothrix hazakensis]BBH89602.1 30S ribosomal protein S8 [Thermosporothrix sp. COM3]GCE47788.1 30S ribosomal protein S8 [Thermosporothrix hazakensis]